MRKDPRLNAKSMPFRNYLLIFLCMLFFCGSYAGLYFLQIKSNALIYIILSMFTYVVLISLVLCFLFAFFVVISLCGPFIGCVMPHNASRPEIFPSAFLPCAKTEKRRI